MKPNNDNNTTAKGPEKRRSTFAILFYINRTKIRKDGMCQLLCKISIDAEGQQIGTKVSVDPALWNPHEGKADGRSRNALEVNRRCEREQRPQAGLCRAARRSDAQRVNDAIEKLTAKITDHYHQIRGSLGFVTAELVKNALNGIAQKPLTLMKLFEEHNTEFKQRVGVDRGKEAYQLYVRSAKHLSAFLQTRYGIDDVSLRSLDLDFYDAYDLFLRTDRHLSQATLSDHIIILKKMTRRAVNQGTLKRDPFHALHPEQPAKVSRHLKLEDLKRLMNYIPDKENLRRVRDWFVFSTFTGLAYADFRRL